MDLKSVAVVTASIGRDELIDCIKSVKEQTHKEVVHYVFGHGFIQSGQVKLVLEEAGKELQPDHLIYLPHNNGANGYGCSTVYAAAPYLIKEDVIMYLDDDNTFAKNHVESMLGLMNKGKLKWAYSLRKVMDHEGNSICEDDCESLGIQPNATGHAFSDQSCYAIQREVARDMSRVWYYPIASDRYVFSVLANNYKPFGTTGLHSVKYRLSKDGSGGMSKEAFLNNNNVMKERHAEFTWRKEAIFQ